MKKQLSPQINKTLPTREAHLLDPFQQFDILFNCNSFRLKELLLDIIWWASDE